MSENTCCQLMLHKSNLWSENLSGYLPLASSESRNDGALLPAYASESGSGYGENHTRWRAYKAKFIEGSSPGELT